MARRHEGSAREGRNVERLRVVAVHLVAGPAQPDEVLQGHATTIPQRSVTPGGMLVRSRRVTPDRFGRSSGVRTDTEADDVAFDETFLRQVPLFAQLAGLWAARGWTVPGRRDPEWERLARPLRSTRPEPDAVRDRPSKAGR
ncbi:hypothetical protein KCMC57_up61550 [Kitasatospora sp. CMC57]|uniref:Uncharacterized protein n=1 Tax=Kitasatospora sp. CMC57 TaxID=3231513 RepID=A0AB33K4S0_9ACTN